MAASRNGALPSSDWSEALRFKSPRTSAALEGVAKMFEDFARRHDEDTERSNWQ
jgi:hypothetical protein